MNASTIFLPIAFLGLAACLAWLVVRSRGAWWTRALLIMSVIFLSIPMWASLGEIQGWPVDGPPEGSFELYGVVIIEPCGEKSGRIYVWLNPKRKMGWFSSCILVFRSPLRNEPRTHALPYSKEMHKKMAEAQRDLRKGMRVMGYIGAAKKKPQRLGKKGKKGSRRSGGTPYKYDANFWYPLPAGGHRKNSPKQ